MAVKRTPLRHKTTKKIGDGVYYPLGATPNKEGVNFALYSKHAKKVFLLLFDDPYGPATDVIEIKNKTRYVWHVFVYGLKAGKFYGFKVKGDYDPAEGLRFNENKFIIDPYSKALTGKVRNTNNLLLSYRALTKSRDLSFDARDSTDVMPKSIIIEDKFDWQGDVHPAIPLEKTIIYEVHLKGFTAHRSSKVKKPGTYMGFIEKIPYLKRLGITAVELLPLQEFYVEDFLLDKGLTNYWGYNTIAFFAPESSYSANPAPGSQVKEFKTMVRQLHKAGIEVIMDVVYNHTGEGNEMGPTISFRGIDNPTYYCLKGSPREPRRYYVNYTGCGNSINASDPYVIRFILDSLRYWVEVMHVDGFRFDLASVLGREGGRFDSNSAFFDVISQDPVLNRVKLIAEPWDMETYEIGKFPVDWSELNGKFRDTLRKFTKGDGGLIKDLRYRLSGSPDLYCKNGRATYNSINFVTNHDGFTIYDTVSYNYKHNEANLENNKDGFNENNSWNCGIEGDTGDPEVLNLRRRLAKNFICSLLLSSGTPLLLGGDEFLRSQWGNNNAYCQDNEISWFNWEVANRNRDFVEFCRRVIEMAKKYKALHIKRLHSSAATCEKSHFRFDWYGRDLDAPAWDNADEMTLSMHLFAKEEDGAEYNLFAMFNADHIPQTIKLPALLDNKRWHRKIDTSLDGGEDFMEDGQEILIEPPDFYIINPRSTVVLAGL